MADLGRGWAGRRLTTHPGNEYFPTFSPDGKLIAFTGEYDGNRDVYVVAGRRRRAAPADLAPGAPTRSSAGRPTAARSSSAARARSAHGGWELFTVPLAGDPPATR